MNTLDYESSHKPGLPRRFRGRPLLAIAICVGVVLVICPGVFGPISMGRGDFHNPLGLIGAILFVVLTTLAVCRRIYEENDPFAAARSVSSFVAIVATALAFAYQFDWGPRTKLDHVRLFVGGVVVLACCLVFYLTRRREPPSIAYAKLAEQATPTRRFEQAFRFIRQCPDVAVVVCLLLLALMFLGVPRIVYAVRVRLWYDAARTHEFPAMSLRYPVGTLRFPSGEYIERRPFLGRFMGPLYPIFAHERSNPHGQKAVVCADLSDYPAYRLAIDVSFMRIRGFFTTTIHNQRFFLEGLIPGGLSGIRIFSGQADPNDASRFYVPVQTPTVSGKLVFSWAEPLPNMPEGEVSGAVTALSVSFEPDAPDK